VCVRVCVCVCVGSPFLLRDSPGVYYRFSPPRESTSYYYCYTDMRIKAYKGSDYTIQLIVKAAHTAQYRFVVWNVTLCRSAHDDNVRIISIRFRNQFICNTTSFIRIFVMIITQSRPTHQFGLIYFNDCTIIPQSIYLLLISGSVRNRRVKIENLYELH